MIHFRLKSEGLSKVLVQKLAMLCFGRVQTASPSPSIAMLALPSLLMG